MFIIITVFWSNILQSNDTLVVCLKFKFYQEVEIGKSVVKLILSCSIC